MSETPNTQQVLENEKLSEMEVLVETLENMDEVKLIDGDGWRLDKNKSEGDGKFLLEEQWCTKLSLELPDDTYYIEVITREYIREIYVVGIVLTGFFNFPNGTRKNEGRIFIPRKKGQTIEEFAEAIKQTYLHMKEMQIEHGEVSTVIDGVRQYLTGVGTFDANPPYKRHNGNPPRFKVPEAKGRRRKITAINQSDSFGKARWRKTLVEQFQKMCPGGYGSLPENERKVLCFPGVGKEAEMWKKLGFQNEDFVFIERDAELAQKLERKYPGAMVINRELGRKYADHYDIAEDISEPHDYYKQFAVINIDPENKLTAKMFKELCGLLKYIRLFGSNCLVGVNFMFKRTDKMSAKCHQSLAGVDPSTMEPEHYYREIIKNVVPRSLAEPYPLHSRSKLKIVSTEHGSYEGDSASTRMYFAMHHLTKP